jgi:hypothetical protein
MSLGFQPLLEQPNLRGTANAIGALDDDKVAPQLLRIYSGDSLAKDAKSTHGFSSFSSPSPIQ